MSRVQSRWPFPSGRRPGCREEGGRKRLALELVVVVGDVVAGGFDEGTGTA
jgi:hypothetical protein